MPGIGEFLQNFMGLRSLQINQQQADVQQRASEAQTTLAGINQMIQLAQASPDPIRNKAMAAVLADRGVAPQDVLETLLGSVAPAESTLRGYGARQGMLEMQGLPSNSLTAGMKQLNKETALRVLTNQTSAEYNASNYLAGLIHEADANPLAAAYRARVASGLPPGDLALQTAQAAMTPEQQAQRALVESGLSMSAPQSAANQLGWANLRQDERRLMLDSALKSLEFDMLKEKGAKGGLSELAKDLPQLLNTKRMLIEELSSSGENMTPDLAKSYLGSLNAINQVLTGVGVFNEGQYDYDPAKVTQPGWTASFKNWLNKGVRSAPGQAVGPGAIGAARDTSAAGKAAAAASLRSSPLLNPTLSRGDSTSRTRTRVSVPTAVFGRQTNPNVYVNPLGPAPSVFDSLGVRR